MSVKDVMFHAALTKQQIKSVERAVLLVDPDKLIKCEEGFGAEEEICKIPFLIGKDVSRLVKDQIEHEIDGLYASLYIIHGWFKFQYTTTSAFVTTRGEQHLVQKVCSCFM